MKLTKKVWFIDEDPDQRSTYGKVLQDIFMAKFQVISIEPKQTIVEMKFIVDDPETSSIIIDERLKDTGIASYLGIDLARYFRSLNDKLPIYILTTYSEDSDLKQNQWSVEYVIKKEDLENDLKTVKARLQRSVSFYYDFVDERERRFNELLAKSLNRPISKEETEELENLQYIRTRSILVDEIGLSADLEDKINKQLKLLDQLQKGA